MRTGAWNEAILDSAKEASVERKNFTRIGLGRGASGLYFPKRKQSFTELA